MYFEIGECKTLILDQFVAATGLKLKHFGQIANTNIRSSK